MTKTQREDETVQLSIRIPRSLHQTIVEKAKEDLRSLNQQIVWLLERAVKTRP